MKYMLLAYSTASTWDDQSVTAEDIARICAFYEQFEQELVESGEWVGSEGLADPSHTTTVRAGVGLPVATDGPLAETKETLVSFSVVDVATRERAVEIARRVVAVTGDSCEVRPVMDPMSDPGAPDR